MENFYRLLCAVGILVIGAVAFGTFLSTVDLNRRLGYIEREVGFNIYDPRNKEAK